MGSGGKGLYGTILVGLRDGASRGAKQGVVIPMRKDRCAMSTSLILVTTKFLKDRSCMAGTFNMRIGRHAGMGARTKGCSAGIGSMFATKSVREKRSLIM